MPKPKISANAACSHSGALGLEPPEQPESSATFAAAKKSVKATSSNESRQTATNGIISTAGNGGNDTYQRPFQSTQSFRFGGCAHGQRELAVEERVGLVDEVRRQRLVREQPVARERVDGERTEEEDQLHAVACRDLAPSRVQGALE